MITMRARSWVLLALLALVVAFAAGVRQGYSVNSKNLARLQELMSQKDAQNKATYALSLVEVANDKCNVSYLYPEVTSSNEATLEMLCDLPASREASLRREQGYVEVSVSSSSGRMSVWIKAAPNIAQLVSRTLTYITPHDDTR